MFGEEELPEEEFIPRVSEIKLTSYHQIMSHAHLGEYKTNLRVNEFDSVDRKFDKDKSIFKDWKVDKQQLIKDGFCAEIEFWKVPNFVKDEEEVQKIIEFMQKHIVFLKTLFIMRAAESNFPTMRWLTFTEMIVQWKLCVDDKDFDVGAVDRIFITVTKNMDKQLAGVFPDKDMSRF